MNNAHERKKGVILSYVAIIINTLVQLIYTPFLIRMLGQSEYGLYSLISSLIGYLTVLDLGFGNAIIVYTAKYRAQEKFEEEKKLHGMFQIVFKIIGIVTALIGILLFFNVDFFFGKTMSIIELKKAKVMMLILSLNLFLTFFFTIYSSIITAYEKFTYQKVLSIINTLLKPLLMIPLLFLGYKSIAMCLVITIVNIIVLMANYIYCKKKLNYTVKYYGFDKKLFLEIFGYSFFIFLGVIVDKINWSVDQFVLGALVGTTAVSLYSVASQINMLFVNLSTAISGVLLPKISKMVAKDASNEELSKEFIKVGRIQFYIVFLMVSGLVLLGKEFFITWAGPEFKETYYIAVILTVPLLIPLIQNLGISIMQAKNLHKFRSLLYLAIALFNIVLSIPLAKFYGGIGSAIGTSISLIIGNIIIINIYYAKKIGIDILQFWKNICKMLVVNLIPIGLIILFMRLIQLSGYCYLLFWGSIYVIIYFIINYYMVMNEEEKYLVNKVLKKVKLKR